MKIIFTKAPTFQSYMIRIGETLYDKFDGGFSKWSHAACVVSNGVRVLDAMKERNGVTPSRTIASFLGGFPDFLIVDVPLPDEAEAEAFLQAQVGKRYDTKAFWGFAAGYNSQDVNSWYCYELVYAALRAGGLPLPATVERITCNRLLALLGPYEAA